VVASREFPPGPLDGRAPIAGLAPLLNIEAEEKEGAEGNHTGDSQLDGEAVMAVQGQVPIDLGGLAAQVRQDKARRPGRRGQPDRHRIGNSAVVIGTPLDARDSGQLTAIAETRAD
jgi:hypothetical protein